MSLRIRIERTDAPKSTARRRRWTVGAATVIATFLVTGVSYAFWNATGSGSATVASLTAQGLSVSPSSPVVSDLYPGKPVQALTFTITNPNSYIVNISSASLGTVTSSDSTNCGIGNLSYPAGPFALNIDVPAGGTATGSIASFVQMKSTAVDGCQGKTFTFPLTLTGMQK